MKIKTQTAALYLAGIMGMAVPVTVLAASPEFTRSAEEWAGLQDNVVEYAEIPDLIHEYNVTVQNNQYEYQKFLKDYGRTREDIADTYRNLADDLEASKTGDDSGAAMVSDMQLDLQAKQMREQADDNIEDSEIHYLNYAQAEDNLVSSAQAKYISYYIKKSELESAREEYRALENNHALAVAKRQVGAVTETAVLDAQEAVLKQQKTISSLEQEIEYTRQALIVMLGWKGSDQPEVTGLVELNLAEIDMIDLEADQQEALTNNYTLKINGRKLQNAQDGDKKKSIQTTIDANKRQIGVSVTSAWQTLQTSRMSYEQAVADAATEERNMALVQQKWSSGMITKYEYEQQQITLTQKQLSVRTAELNLMEALKTYRWTVGGLAAAEGIVK